MVGTSMRTELTFKLECSECGALLECDNQKSKFTSNSAFTENAVFSINPCARCMSAAKRPVELLKEALSGIV